MWKTPFHKSGCINKDFGEYTDENMTYTCSELEEIYPIFKLHTLYGPPFTIQWL